MRTTVIELYKEGMKFSAGHFTIFSATDRENVHGHNFNVYVSITTEITENGMCFDYGDYKKRITDLCHQWNEIFILPSRSKYLTITEDEKYIYAEFNHEKIIFLKRDVLVLPIENATLEEFSSLILDQLISNPEEVENFKIQAITVKVFSGPGQCASANWNKD